MCTSGLSIYNVATKHIASYYKSITLSHKGKCRKFAPFSSEKPGTTYEPTSENLYRDSLGCSLRIAFCLFFLAASSNGARPVSNSDSSVCTTVFSDGRATLPDRNPIHWNAFFTCQHNGGCCTVPDAADL
jgi:hypothetical protein